MIGKSLIDFIHPEEKQVAQEDFAKFKSSNSIFGSVTRCVACIIYFIVYILLVHQY